MFKMMQNAPSSEYLFKVNYFKDDATNEFVGFEKIFVHFVGYYRNIKQMHSLEVKL